jgi:flotillin
MLLQVSWVSLVMMIGMPAAIMMTMGLFLITRYKRCPSNRLLVVYGKVGGDATAKVIHGGGTLVLPVIQSYMYLSLDPLQIKVELDGLIEGLNSASTSAATMTVQISTEPQMAQNAAERLLGLTLEEVQAMAQDIIRGQLSLLLDQKSIEQWNSDRRGLNKEAVGCAEAELSTVGLEIVAADIPRLVAKG